MLNSTDQRPFFQVVERSRLDHNLALGYVLSLQKLTAVDTLKKLQAAAGHHYKRVRVEYLVFLYWIFAAFGIQELDSFKCNYLLFFFHLFQSLALVGVDFAELSKEPKLLLMCKDAEKNAYWGNKLNKLKVGYYYR